MATAIEVMQRSAHRREGACDARPNPAESPRPVHTLGRDLRADRHDLCTDLS